MAVSLHQRNASDGAYVKCRTTDSDCDFDISQSVIDVKVLSSNTHNTASCDGSSKCKVYYNLPPHPNLYRNRCFGKHYLKLKYACRPEGWVLTTTTVPTPTTTTKATTKQSTFQPKPTTSSTAASAPAATTEKLKTLQYLKKTAPTKPIPTSTLETTSDNPWRGSSTTGGCQSGETVLIVQETTGSRSL